MSILDYFTANVILTWVYRTTLQPMWYWPEYIGPLCSQCDTNLSISDHITANVILICVYIKPLYSQCDSTWVYRTTLQPMWYSGQYHIGCKVVRYTIIKLFPTHMHFCSKITFTHHCVHFVSILSIIWPIIWDQMYN